MQGSSKNLSPSWLHLHKLNGRHHHIDGFILVDLDYALQAAMVPIRGFSDRPGLSMVVADVFNLGAARATPRDDF
jgi:hypothetical protein